MTSSPGRFVIVREQEIITTDKDKTRQAWTTPEKDGILPISNHSKTTNTDEPRYIDCYEGSNLYRELRPLFRSLRFSGLFFKRVETKDGKVVIGKWGIVCVLLCIIMIANTIRSLLLYKKGDPFDGVMCAKILLSLWSVELLIKSVVFLCAAFKKDLLPYFFQLWTEVCRERGPDKFLNIVMKKSIMLNWNFTIVNTVGISLVFFLVPELENLLLKTTLPGAETADFTLPYKIIMIILIYLMSTVSMSSVSLLVVLSVALTREFLAFNKDFSSKISPDGSFKADLEEYRLRHQGLCRLVDVLDDIFTVMVAAVLLFNIPMCCVLLYYLIYANPHFSILLLNIFWVLFLIAHMSIVCVACAYINVGVTMFLNRLSGTDIGVSVLKMFVINRPALLTITGMLITYFVLLLQFKSPSTTVCTCFLNSTEIAWNGSVVVT